MQHPLAEGTPLGEQQRPDNERDTRQPSMSLPIWLRTCQERGGASLMGRDLEVRKVLALPTSRWSGGSCGQGGGRGKWRWRSRLRPLQQPLRPPGKGQQFCCWISAVSLECHPGYARSHLREGPRANQGMQGGQAASMARPRPSKPPTRPFTSVIKSRGPA